MPQFFRKKLFRKAELGEKKMSSPESSEPEATPSEDTARASATYEEPLVVDASKEHKQSWIVLHGRGDRAQHFANGMLGFLGIPLPDGRGIQEHLPHVRFIFPTASPRRAKSFNRAIITQWFDLYSWNSTEHTDRQIEGLRETSAWIHELIRREIEAVGAENVVLGGLSQGCASSLISLLLWQGEPIKAVFGMSGWLPFQHVLDMAMEMALNGALEDVFERTETELAEASEAKKDPYSTAIKWLCQELQVEQVKNEAVRKVPIFIAHGGRDETVDTERGREAAECLGKLGFVVEYKEYATLTHWMRSDEFSDIIDFVAKCDKT